MSPSAQVATLFGLGRVKPLPGTLASLTALPIGWWIGVLAGALGLLGAALLITFVGLLAAGQYAKAVEQKDPSECVIDEVAGQWFALVPLAFTGHLSHLLSLALAFLLFRALDILKPWPIYKLQDYPGGAGIMIDDIVAGILAGILVAAAGLVGWI
ncbi:MAG: phosphatidylglycerophosphatase A family protein [Alphaproteobacteria bacterium]